MRTGSRDFRRLTGLLEQPLAVLGDRAPAKPVWHCAVRAAPGDPDLGDGAWMRIAAEIMHRTGLSRHGEEDKGVRWVAVHHGENHIHIVATLARQDGRRAMAGQRLLPDRRGPAGHREAEYGLQVVVRADRTAAKRPTRAEQEKAARADRPEPPRVTLQRQVAAAAAGARSEPEFWAALDKRGVLVRLRHSTHNPGEVTGYAVGLDGDTTAAGEQIWYGGGKLAPDLSLPKLRRRWPEPGERTHRQHSAADGAQPRLSGHGMTSRSSRAVLRREVNMCAAAARSEQEFFAGLDSAGLLVRLRHSPTQPAQVTGYSVSLPGMTHWDGQQVWYGGQTLDGQLGLGALRRRWQAGRPGTPPAPEAFAGADTRDIFGYATAVAAEAARQLRVSPTAAQSADIAWAAADVLTAAAQATGSPELQQAADGFSRAARASWGRIPPSSPGGAALRTAAYLLAACAPDRIPPYGSTRLTLISALAGLARAVAAVREAQNRLLQAAAAHSAAAVPGRRAASNGPAAPPRLATARLPAASGPTPDRGPDQRPRPGQAARLSPVGPGPGRPGPGRGRAGDTPGRGCGPGVPRKCHEHFPIAEEQGQKACRAAPPGRTDARGTIRRPSFRPAYAAASRAEYAGYGRHTAAAPDPAGLGRVTTRRWRPSARADRGHAPDLGAVDSRHLVRRVIAQDITASTGSGRPASRYTCDVASADGMASLLATVLAVSERPVTLLLEELAHIEIRFEVLSRTDRELTASEHRRLDADPIHCRASPRRASADQGRHRGGGNRTGHPAAAAACRCPRRPGRHAHPTRRDLGAARRAAAGLSRLMSRGLSGFRWQGRGG